MAPKVTTLTLHQPCIRHTALPCRFTTCGPFARVCSSAQTALLLFFPGASPHRREPPARASPRAKSSSRSWQRGQRPLPQRLQGLTVSETLNVASSSVEWGHGGIPPTGLGVGEVSEECV